jgi:fluoride exporter
MSTPTGPLPTTGPQFRPPELTASRAALVGGGGMVGASLRWGIGHELGWDAAPGLPWAVLLVNTVGTVLLVLALDVSRRQPDRASLLVDGVGTGFCGGLTTFSAFALINAQHLDDGSVGWAALSIGAVMICGLAAATVTRLVVERRRDDGEATT